MTLTGRIAVIGGGSGKVGSSIAEVLAAHGAYVIVQYN